MVNGFPRDSELESFVDRFVTSFAAWDLLVLLGAHPDLVDTPEQLAQRLGRNPKDIGAAASGMAEGRVLATGANPEGERTYGLSAEVRASGLVERFTAATADRDWRLELVRRVLAKLQ